MTASERSAPRKIVELQGGLSGLRCPGDFMWTDGSLILQRRWDSAGRIEIVSIDRESGSISCLRELTEFMRAAGADDRRNPAASPDGRFVLFRAAGQRAVCATVAGEMVSESEVRSPEIGWLSDSSAWLEAVEMPPGSMVGRLAAGVGRISPTAARQLKSAVSGYAGGIIFHSLGAGSARYYALDKPVRSDRILGGTASGPGVLYHDWPHVVRPTRCITVAEVQLGDVQHQHVV